MGSRKTIITIVIAQFSYHLFSVVSLTDISKMLGRRVFVENLISSQICCLLALYTFQLIFSLMVGKIYYTPNFFHNYDTQMMLNNAI